MDILIFIVMLLLLISEAFFFRNNLLPFIASCVAGAVYLLFRIFFKKKFKKLPGTLICYAILVVFTFFILQIDVKENGEFVLYAEDPEQVCEYLHQGAYDKASEMLRQMKETYGETDTTHMLNAISKLSAGKTKEALGAYQRLNDKQTMISIVIAEEIYMSDKTGKHTDDLFDLYCTAAEQYPEWEYIQLCAGVNRIDFKQYQTAQYNLYNAYAVNSRNPQTCFFLGVTYYKLGDDENALYYFNASVENGADEKVKKYIKGYLDEMDCPDKEGCPDEKDRSDKESCL